MNSNTSGVKLNNGFGPLVGKDDAFKRLYFSRNLRFHDILYAKHVELQIEK